MVSQVAGKHLPSYGKRSTVDRHDLFIGVTALQMVHVFS